MWSRIKQLVILSIVRHFGWYILTPVQYNQYKQILQTALNDITQLTVQRDEYQRLLVQILEILQQEEWETVTTKIKDPLSLTVPVLATRQRCNCCKSWKHVGHTADCMYTKLTALIPPSIYQIDPVTIDTTGVPSQ